MQIDYDKIFQELGDLQWRRCWICRGEGLPAEEWFGGYYEKRRIISISKESNSALIDDKLVYDIKHTYLHDRRDIILEDDVKSVLFGGTAVWIDAGGEMVKKLRKVIDLSERLIKLNYIKQKKDEIYAESKS